MHVEQLPTEGKIIRMVVPAGKPGGAHNVIGLDVDDNFKTRITYGGGSRKHDVVIEDLRDLAAVDDSERQYYIEHGVKACHLSHEQLAGLRPGDKVDCCCWLLLL